MRTLSTCLFFLLALAYAGNAQKQTIIPPSPSPSAIASYLDYPVGHYTGMPDINIPVYELREGDLKIPISLSYMSRGLKVEETPSNVGSGWSLQAGGLITRVVKGLPDDYNKDRYIGAQPRNGIPGDRPFDTSPEGEHPQVGLFWHNEADRIAALNELSPDNAYIREQITKITHKDLSCSWYNNLNDTQQDIFYFSFNGKSGKFVFEVTDNVQVVRLMPQQDLKITHSLDNLGKIASFTVTDETGNIYYFDKIEQLEIRADSEGHEKNGSNAYSGMTYLIFNSSWYLSKITAVNGKEVLFSYINEGLMETSLPITSRGGSAVHDLLNTSISRMVSSTVKRISEISSEAIKIVFNAAHQREDLYEPAYAITSIEVFDKTLPVLRNIKNLKLGYSYFLSNPNEPLQLDQWYSAQGNPLGSSYRPHYYKRLKLDYVQEYTAVQQLPKTVFRYNESVSLPNRLSLQQDLWGYFNAAAGNQTMIPTIYVDPDLTGSERFSVIPKTYSGTNSFSITEADRLPNAAYMGIGNLNRITYPTGGRTDYIFEPHTYNYNGQFTYGGGLRIKQISAFDNDTDIIPQLTRSFLYHTGNEEGSTSGKIIEQPVFAAPAGLTNFLHFYRFSVSQAPLGTTQGSTVGYKEVKEILGGSTNNIGKIRYTFNMPATAGESSDPDGIYQVPQPHSMFIYSIWHPGNCMSEVSSDYWDPATFKHQFVAGTRPFADNPYYDWNRGQLLSKEEFDNGGNLLRKTENGYSLYYPNNAQAPRKVYGLVSALLGNDYADVSPGHFVFNKYIHLTEVAKVLRYTKNVIYTTGDTTKKIVKTDYFKYNSPWHMNASEKKTTDSKGDSLIVRYTYPDDYHSGWPLAPEIESLRNRHMKSALIEECVYKKTNGTEKLLSSTFVEYGNDAGQVRPVRTYAMEEEFPLPNFAPSTSNAAPELIVKDSRYKEKVFFSSYTSNNKITESVSHNVTNSYIWDYKQQYPIAQVKNAKLNDVAYSSFEADGNGGWSYNGIVSQQHAFTGNRCLSFAPTGGYISKSGLDPAKKYRVSMWFKGLEGNGPDGNFVQIAGPNSDGWAQYETTVSGISTFSYNYFDCFIDEIRLHPVGAQMTTYTYLPGTGITHSSDASERISYYAYDGFGRLSVVKDQNGFIVKTYCYNYKGQLADCGQIFNDPVSVQYPSVFSTSFEDSNAAGVITDFARTGSKSFDTYHEWLPPSAMFYQKILTGLSIGRYGLSWYSYSPSGWILHEQEFINSSANGTYTIEISGGTIDDINVVYKGTN
jgi:YD repeat-containing protein